MNQFDQEIKNRINSKSYDYQPQAWKSFKHQSGMPMVSTAAKIAIVGSSAAVITGSVLFFTLPSNNTPESDNTIIAQEQISEPQNNDQNIDTVDFAEIAKVENTIDTSTEPATSAVAATTKPKTQVPAQAQAQPQTQPQAQTQAQTPTQAKPKPQPQSNYYGRPLRILVDTIASIDFPDYETKPADMLP